MPTAEPLVAQCNVHNKQIGIVLPTLELGVALDICPKLNDANTSFGMIFESAVATNAETYHLSYDSNLEHTIKNVKYKEAVLTDPKKTQSIALLLSVDSLQDIIAVTGQDSQEEAPLQLVQSGILQKPVIR